MSEPETDPWADLYADLGVGNKATSGPSHGGFFGAVPTGDLDSIAPEPDAEDAAGDGEDAADEADGDGGTDPDGQPKRKRRRRRRRGRKGDAVGLGDALAAVNAPAADADPDADTPGREPLTLEPPAQYDDNSEDLDLPDDPDADPALVGEPAGDADDEAGDDAGAAAPRELIADWNVPSWQEIVSGLYRPDR